MRHILIYGLAGCVLLLCSCAQEDQPYNESYAFDFKGAGPQCLSDAPDTVHRYFNGNLESTDEVRDLFGCVRQALDLFRKYVKGAQPGNYQATELRDFLHQFFLGNIRVSDALLSELMEFKRLLVGGTNTSFKAEDLERLELALKEFEIIFIELYPHIKVFSRPQKDLDLETIATLDDFESSLEAINNVSLRLGKLIQANGNGYSFAHLERFLAELSKLFEQDHADSNLAKMQQYVPLVRKLKSSFIAAGDDGIASDQWIVSFSSMSRIIGIWLRIEHFIIHSEWRQSSGLYQTTVTFAAIRDFLKDALKNIGKTKFSHAEIFALIDEFGKMHSLPFGFSVDEAKQLWQTMVDRVLADQSHEEGLTADKIDFIDREFSLWHGFQNLALEYLTSGGTSSNWEFKLGENDSAMTEFKRVVLDAPWPLVNDSKGRLRIGQQLSQTSHDLNSLSRLNWERALIRLLVMAYAKDPVARNNLRGLTADELKAAYLDLKPALVAIGLVNSSDNSFHSRIRQEANLFLPRSNGDSILDYEEGVEYLHYVLSGISAGKYLKADVKDYCGLSNGSDSEFDTTCFRDRFRDRFSDYLDHMPGLVAYSSHLNLSQWQELERHLEQTIRHEGYASTPIATSDITEMLILLQYIETFVVRFDDNGSETINKKESLTAEPIFHDTLKELIDVNLGDWFVTSIFTWMMKTGAPPNTDFGSLIEFGFWMINPSSWKYEADRTTLASILSSLAEKRRGSNKSLAHEVEHFMTYNYY